MSDQERGAQDARRGRPSGLRVNAEVRSMRHPHRPPSGRHRPGPRPAHRHHHQRPRQQDEGPDRAVRPADDHRAAPRRDRPGVLRRRPVLHRRPRRGAVRPGSGPARRVPHPARASYATATPDTLQRRFLDSSGTISISGDTVTVRIDRRAYSPVLRQASLPADTTVPWCHARRLHFEFS